MKQTRPNRLVLRVAPLSIALLIFADSSSAQSVDVTVVGTVSTVVGTGPGSFSGAAAGDAVTAVFSAAVPGTPSALGSGFDYVLDPAASSLSIGAVSEGGSAAGAVTLLNDDPMLGDLIALALDVPSGTVVSFTLDPAGALLSTDDLSTLSGSSISTPVGTQLSFLDPNSQGEIQVDVVRIDFGPSTPIAVGMPYCTPTAPNSTGVAAELSAQGSNLVADDDVTLECSQLPQGAFGFFLASRTQGMTANPGGSRGTLCLGGQIGRYVGPGQIQNSGAAGRISLALDLTAIPSPSGFVAAQAGETWSFQAWYRDSAPSGVTSDFSNGYEIAFQ